VAATADVLPALPPGPTLPPLAQTLAIVGAPGAFLGRMQERYGDVFTIRVLGAAFVVIADPAAIREVFRGSTDVLLAGRSNEPLAPLVGRRSLLLLDGAEHLRERKLLLPPFHGANLRAHERIMERATRRAMQDWPLDRPFALLPAMQDITLEVTGFYKNLWGLARGSSDLQLADGGLLHHLRPGGGDEQVVAVGAVVGQPAGQRALPGGGRVGPRDADPSGVRQQPADRPLLPDRLALVPGAVLWARYRRVAA